MRNGKCLTIQNNIKIISFLVGNGSKVIPDLTDEETITDNDDAKNFCKKLNFNKSCIIKIIKE